MTAAFVAARPRLDLVLSPLRLSPQRALLLLVAAIAIVTSTIVKDTVLESIDPLTTLLSGLSLCVILVAGYFWLYVRNACIYAADGLFGCRWASGRGVSVPADEVDRLERVLVVSPGGLRSRLLAARTREGRVLFVAGSGNWFDDQSLSSVTQAAGISLTGDFDQPVSELDWSNTPGAVSGVTRTAARLNARPWLQVVIGLVVTVFIFAVVIWVLFSR